MKKLMIYTFTVFLIIININCTKTGTQSWSKHSHPHGFSFDYPSDWTVNDDMENKSTLLCPPGITMDSPGPKAIFIITALPGVKDITSLRPYAERQFPGANIIRFNQELFKAGNNQGFVLDWYMNVPQSGVTSGFRVYTVFLNNMAVCIYGFGPSEKMNVHDSTMRRIVTSFEWK